MPLSIGNVVLRVDDLDLEATFWAAALGYERRQVDADDFAQVVAPEGSGPSISFDRYRGADRVPPRIHLDLFTDDQAGDVARLEGLGARQVHWDRRPPDADYVIMEDPEGNRFCVVDTSRQGAADLSR
jgi:predicted enzyme related to lactoylglutathione lyase